MYLNLSNQRLKTDISTS